jgi:hypothetical protein
MLKTNQSITHMTIGGNDVGDEGAKYIGDVLKANTTIHNLFIMDCGISHLSEG